MLGVREFYRSRRRAGDRCARLRDSKRIPRVDKIVGPGNLYVTAAKKLVAFDCAIDFLAGPTEIVVVSDTGNPEFIAADLVAQAEHDPEALAVFITTSTDLASDVGQVAVKKFSSQGTPCGAMQSLATRGAILVAARGEQSLRLGQLVSRPNIITIDEQRFRAGSKCRIGFHRRLFGAGR